MHVRLLLLALTLLTSTAAADSVRSLDGKVYDGKASIDAAGVNVQPKGNQPAVKVPFSQLLRARFDSSDPIDPHDNAEAWSAIDIGETPQPGSHKFNKHQLTIETAGTGVGGRADACRFVYQGFRGSAEVSAKLTGGGQWREKTAAGVMMRVSVDPAARSVALLLSRDQGLYMVIRGNPGFDSVVTAIGRMRAPMHIRLTREADYVRAWRSPDGKTWIKVGEVKAAMGDDPVAGAVVASREEGMSAPVFESLRVASDDIPGATAVDVQEIRATARGGNEARDDKRSLLKVNQLSLSRGLPDGGTAEMTFDLDAKYAILSGQAYILDKDKLGGGVTLQLFLDGEKVFDTGKMTADAHASAPFNLPVSGKRALRLVMIDGGGGKPFATAGVRNMVLLAVKPTRTVARASGAQVVTTDGAIYAGAEIKRVGDDKVEFARGPRRDLSIPQKEVARILYPSFEPPMAAQIPAAGSGVVLPSGDFYEGDIDRFDPVGRVQVNSVIFGPREFNLRNEVAALVLRPVATEPSPAAFEVHAADGSVLPAASLSAEGSNLSVNDRHVGKLVIDARSIREIRYGGDRLKWVADLRPRRVNPGPGRAAADSFVIDATPLGSSLRLLDTEYERGVSLSTGTSVSYDIDGRYNTLLSVAGVPAEVMPSVAVVFVIEADGKEVFRSPLRTSVHDPLPITVDTTGVKTVTFRVEPAPGMTLPAVALFGDPLLIKSTP